MALVAWLGGILVGLARALNGRLGMQRGALRASVWNHVVGFGFMTVLLVATGTVPWAGQGGPTPFWLLGGVIGALYVSLNTWVVPRLGSTVAALLVVCAQLLASLVLDAVALGHVQLRASMVAGLLLTALGVALSLRPGRLARTATKPSLS